MARVLTWVSDQQLTGWACSACDWTFPLPSLLSDPEAKKAYDRLASAKFQRHDCATHQPVASLNPESFIARAKGLVMRVQRETVLYTCQSMYTKPNTDIASRITDAVSTRSTIDLSGIHVFTHRTWSQPIDASNLRYTRE